MFKKAMLGVVTASALALGAPPALAHDATFDCDFNAVQQEDATGQNFEGVARGWVVHSDGGTVTIRCFVKVNGTETSSTPTGTGEGAATTAGRVTYAAGDTDVVELCATATWPGGSRTVCFPTSRLQVPPQEVIDLLIDIIDIIDGVIIEYVDPVLCDQLDNHPGVYGPIEIKPDGDVYINGEFFWDCKPYASPPPA